MADGIRGYSDACTVQTALNAKNAAPMKGGVLS
jgi:hypothetical protein